MSRPQDHAWRSIAGTAAAGCVIVVFVATMAGVVIPANLRADDSRSHTAEKPAFNRDIRPILADKCFKCHGPDARQRKGKLRLDNRRDATAPAASGSPAIVPGKLDDSELYRRITSDDPDERMPPPKSGKSLSAAEIARLKTWIEAGGRISRALGVSAPGAPAAAAGQESPAGAATRSTSSSWPGSRPRASRRRPRPTRSR